MRIFWRQKPCDHGSFFDPHRNEYFFDRNRNCFDAILYYYQVSTAKILNEDITNVILSPLRAVDD